VGASTFFVLSLERESVKKKENEKSESTEHKRKKHEFA
jgi:hypothetical protein